MVLTGIILALGFDCYRVLRNSLKLRGLATAIGDIVYWLWATAVVFLALLKGNWGELRFYIFLALTAGATFYCRFLSTYTVALLWKLIHGICRLLRLVQLVLTYLVLPLVYPVRWGYRCCVGGVGRLRSWLHKPPPKPPD